METAIYWVEYVVRHKGAPHLRSTGQNLDIVTYHNLDVYAFFVISIYLLCYIIMGLFTAVFGRRHKLFETKSKVKSN